MSFCLSFYSSVSSPPYCSSSSSSSFYFSSSSSFIICENLTHRLNPTAPRTRLPLQPHHDPTCFQHRARVRRWVCHARMWVDGIAWSMGVVFSFSCLPFCLSPSPGLVLPPSTLDVAKYIYLIGRSTSPPQADPQGSSFRTVR